MLLVHSIYWSSGSDERPAYLQRAFLRRWNERTQIAKGLRVSSGLRHRFRDLRPPGVAWCTVNTAMVAGNRQVGWPYPQCRVDMEQNPGV